RDEPDDARGRLRGVPPVRLQSPGAHRVAGHPPAGPGRLRPAGAQRPAAPPSSTPVPVRQPHVRRVLTTSAQAMGARVGRATSGRALRRSITATTIVTSTISVVAPKPTVNAAVQSEPASTAKAIPVMIANPIAVPMRWLVCSTPPAAPE